MRIIPDKFCPDCHIFPVVEVRAPLAVCDDAGASPSTCHVDREIVTFEGEETALKWCVVNPKM